jgi:Ca-activated chloride channel family protein
MRVMQKGKAETLYAQELNSKQKYLLGTYDLEIFTLPRTYTQVKVEQGKNCLVDVVPAGQLNYTAAKPVVGQIFVIKNSNEMEWVCNLEDGSTSGTWFLQPGNYKIIYREKEMKSTSYTREKAIKIESNKINTITL